MRLPIEPKSPSTGVERVRAEVRGAVTRESTLDSPERESKAMGMTGLSTGLLSRMYNVAPTVTNSGSWLPVPAQVCLARYQRFLFRKIVIV